MRPLVAVETSDPWLVYELVERALEDQIAVFPLDHRLPKNHAEALLARVRPTVWADGTKLDGGIGVGDDVALVVATSATTGPPKAVELSKRALVASAVGSAAALGSSPLGRWLCCLPVARIAGLSTLVRSILAGARPEIVIPFDPALVMAADAQLISLVPAMLHRLLRSGWDPSSFEAILLGGGPIPGALVSQTTKAGGRVVATYGMTETCGGCVYDGVSFDGVQVATDATSQILIKGDVVMNGYRLDPEATATKIERGWLRTGDLGSLTDGILNVNGRMDDVITTGGEKVSPTDVETALRQIDGVVDALVTWVADELWGQKTVALVVQDGTLDESSARQRAKKLLARHQVPSSVLFVDDLPMTQAGKPDRQAARDMAFALFSQSSLVQKAHTEAPEGTEERQ